MSGCQSSGDGSRARHAHDEGPVLTGTPACNAARSRVT
jgi:hypothetical protein